MNDTKLDELYCKAQTRKKILAAKDKAFENLERRLWKLLPACEMGVIGKPAGFWGRTCPECRQKLERRYPYGDWEWLCCVSCDYEWAYWRGDTD